MYSKNEPFEKHLPNDDACLFIYLLLFLRILSTVLIIYVSLVTENQQFGNYLN